MHPADGDEDRLTAHVAVFTKMPDGRLLIDEIILRSNVIREARRARWPEACVGHLEDDLVSALAVFLRIADGLRV